MPVELAEIAAGIPFAASFAMAGGIAVLREGRRRASLNEAVHELRRPLQALALSLPADPHDGGAAGSALLMAGTAIDRLDREINGEAAGTVAERVPVRPMIEAAEARWRPHALAVGRSLGLRWDAAEPALWGHAMELAQAVDNLISNGFEHGRGPVEICASEEKGELRIAVRDGGAGPRTRSPRPLGRARPRRHGHGLKIVRRVAAGHGGSFRLRRSAAGTEARLELPLAGGGR
ncbi:MAG TPA: HAMP domain-containing sensor histidine kinase [Solirubrobacterales bacterium]|nr:HAMP domain-containing sensor histidine kinase [Solirubrobacterales bacterium]